MKDKDDTMNKKILRIKKQWRNFHNKLDDHNIKKSSIALP